MTETRQQPTWLMNDFDFENHMGIGMRTAETIARAERAARIAAEAKRDELADLVVRYSQAELPEAINDLAYDRDKHFKRAEAAEAKLAAVEAERAKAREDALREAANLVRGEVYREKNRTWLYMLPQANGCRGNRGEDDFVTQHCDTLAAAILALTAPAGGERNEGETES